MADKITAQATFRAQRNLINEMVDFKADLNDTIANGGRLLVDQAPVRAIFDATLQATSPGDGTVVVVLGDTGSQTYYYDAYSEAVRDLYSIQLVDDLGSPIAPLLGQILYLQIDNSPETKIPPALYVQDYTLVSGGNIKTVNHQRMKIHSSTDGLYYVVKFIFDGTHWIALDGPSGDPGYSGQPVRFTEGGPYQFTLSGGGGDRAISVSLGHDNTYFYIATIDGLSYTITSIAGNWSHMRELYLHVLNDNITMQHNGSFQQSEGADVVTRAGDVLKYIYDAPNWKLVGMSRSASSINPRALYKDFPALALSGAADTWLVPTSGTGVEVYIDDPITRSANFGWNLPEGYYAKHWLSGYITSTVAGRDVVAQISHGTTPPQTRLTYYTAQTKLVSNNTIGFSIETPPIPILSGNDSRHDWAFKEYYMDGLVSITVQYMGVEVLGYGG